MKVGVLGFNGFMGKNLCQHLKSSFEVVEVSLRDTDWETQLQQCDVYINLVGKAHDHKGVATELDYYYANSDLPKRVFEVFLKSEAKLYIHVSSLAAQQELKSDRALLEDDPCQPVTTYGKSKRDFEEWILKKTPLTDKKVIVLRPPMVHGPGDKGNLGVLYKLISKGIPYPLNAFKNERSFLSIDNFCYFVKKIIDNQGKLISGIYNVSDDEPVSTTKIINIIKNEASKKVINVSLPKFFVKAIAKIGDVLPIPLNSVRLEKMTSNLLVSNHKIKTALEIEKLPLSAEEGLRKTIRSFVDKKN